DHEGQMPSWSLFFEEAMAPPRCPSATARLSNIGNGGYAWGPVLDSTRKFNEVPPNAWLASDRIPWHDPKRAGRNDGFWEGRVNSLRVDGHIEWIRLLTPP